MKSTDNFVCITHSPSGFSVNGARTQQYGWNPIDSVGLETAPGAIYCKWEWINNCFNLSNDRYGLFPIYYWCSSDTLIMSPDIHEVISRIESRKLDFRALSVFLRLGFFIGDRTPFENIRVLPPRAMVRWEDGSWKIEGNYPEVKENSLERNEAIGGFGELFSQAILRQEPNGVPFVIPLSGGRDSRHILFELVRQGHRPAECVTCSYYDINSNDLEIAGLVTQKLEVPLHTIYHQRQNLDSIRKTVHKTNFCSDEHVWMGELADHLNRNAKVVYDGLAGDVLSAGLFLNEQLLMLYKRPTLDELCEKLLPDFISPLLSPKWQRYSDRDTALSELHAELIKHLGMPNPIAMFYFWNRTRREVALAPFALYSTVPSVRVPFLDEAVFDFLAGLPAEHFLDHSFHSEAISRRYPEWNDLPYSSKFSIVECEQKNWTGNFSFSMSVMRYVLMKPRLGPSSRSFLATRLLRCAIDRKFVAEINWFGPWTIYLEELGDALGC